MLHFLHVFPVFPIVEDLIEVREKIKFRFRLDLIDRNGEPSAVFEIRPFFGVLRKLVGDYFNHRNRVEFPVRIYKNHIKCIGNLNSPRRRSLHEGRVIAENRSADDINMFKFLRGIDHEFFEPLPGALIERRFSAG
jgi:hypothetical protein